MSKSQVLGVDIGGANLKFADSCGHSYSTAFPMWTEHEHLSQALAIGMRSLRDRYNLPSFDLVAVTMTGELADCFATRRMGVTQILDQVELLGLEIAVYSTDGNWLTPGQARQQAWDVAASNWHALACWLLSPALVSLSPASSSDFDLIVDVGSTTVDIVPVVDGRIATAAKTDRQRMQLGQLVYTGMQRTPVAAICQALDVDSERCPLMAERFATSDDAYLVLELVDESDCCDTADGQPRTRVCAASRLARMVGEDAETLCQSTIAALANQVIDAQVHQVADAISRNLFAGARPSNVLISGHGRPLMNRVLSLLPQCAPHWLDECLPAEAARCAPAVAVASLRENWGA
ncbi:MAG: hydantoinase/oxoprolinase family protein [Pirellulaceae bacterium]